MIAVTKPKISVIVPVYNREKVLTQTIGSVRNQTLQDWELILIDDGSTDGSFDVCRSAAAEDPRVRILRTVNQGQCVARNIGLALARADYIKFLDSDDLLVTRALEAQVFALERFNASIARCEPLLFFEDELARKAQIAESRSVSADLAEHEEMESVLELERRYLPTFNEILIHRDLLEKAGGFLAGLVAAEEGTLLKMIAIRAGDRQRIVSTKTPLLLKRLDPGSLAVQARNDGRGSEASLRANVYVLEMATRYGEPAPGFRDEILARLYRSATYSYRNGKRSQLHRALEAWQMAEPTGIPLLTPSFHYRLHKIFGFWIAEWILACARSCLRRRKK